MRRLHSRCPQDLTFKDQTGARNCPNPGKTFRISQSLGRARRRALLTQTPPGPAKRRPGKHHDAHGRGPVARPFPGRNAAIPPHTPPRPARPPSSQPGLGRDSEGTQSSGPDVPIARFHETGFRVMDPDGPGPRPRTAQARAPGPADPANGRDRRPLLSVSPPPPLPPSSCLLL